MNMSLSKLDREKRPDAFEVTLSDGKTTVVFADPKLMHFETFMAFEELSGLERLAALTGDKYEQLIADPELNVEAMELIMEGWQEHYGVGDRGEGSSS